MQAELSVYCGGCELPLGRVRTDTADMPEELQRKVNAVVLAHRKGCPYYQIVDEWEAGALAVSGR